MNLRPGCQEVLATEEDRIIASWQANAVPWTAAVRKRHIESRRLVTDEAIVDAVMSRGPHTVLDIGCGEGWLARALAQRGVSVLGVDAVSSLVDQAREAGGAQFRVLAYRDLAVLAAAGTVDAAVCNFALLGKESVEVLFATVPSLLAPGGVFILQTLHPLMACGDLPYWDGWREGSWAGFSADFTDPAPWYFRTLQSWVRLFAASGLRLLELREPPHPGTGRPASLIIIAAVDSRPAG